MNAPNEKVTTLGELRRPLAPETQLPVVRMGFSDLQGFELMQRAAKALAASTLVPQQFQGNLPNCLIALEMASRVGASPLMVMQNLYIVHGRPGWSAQFLIASFNQCGRFSAMRFRWQGKPGEDEWGCRAWALEKATEEEITGPLITINLAKREGWYEKSGSKWKTIPELMLMYRAAAWMVRTHAPEISMGLSTAEELGDVYDAQPAPNGTYTVQTVGELAPVAPEVQTTPAGEQDEQSERSRLLDWIATLDGCAAEADVTSAAADAPEQVRADPAFAKAVKARLDVLKGKKK